MSKTCICKKIKSSEGLTFHDVVLGSYFFYNGTNYYKTSLLEDGSHNIVNINGTSQYMSPETPVAYSNKV